MPGSFRITFHIGTGKEGLDREETIKKASEKEGLSVSEWVNKAIDKALKK